MTRLAGRAPESSRPTGRNPLGIADDQSEVCRRKNHGGPQPDAKTISDQPKHETVDRGQQNQTAEIPAAKSDAGNDEKLGPIAAIERCTGTTSAAMIAAIKACQKMLEPSSTISL